MNNIKIPHPNNLTPIEKTIYQFVSNNQNKVANMTLQEICDQLFISNATVVRFTQKIGFSGFNEFKQFLKNEKEANDLHTDSSHLKNEQLNQFIKSINTETIEAICQLIIHSHTIYIYGRDISSIPASYLHAVLNTMDIFCININWIDLLQSISKTIPKDTLVIMFTNQTNRPEYKQVLDYCEQNEAKIVWISDHSFDDFLLSKIDVAIFTNETSIHYNDNTMKINMLFLVQLILERIIYLQEQAAN